MVRGCKSGLCYQSPWVRWEQKGYNAGPCCSDWWTGMRLIQLNPRNFFWRICTEAYLQEAGMTSIARVARLENRLVEIPNFEEVLSHIIYIYSRLISLQREGTDIPLEVQLISEDLGLKLEKVQSEMLGGAKKVSISFLNLSWPSYFYRVHASFPAFCHIIFKQVGLNTSMSLVPHCS